MTEKELKKMNRYQLLEIIIMQTEELQKLSAELEQVKLQLTQQHIRSARAGNIAQEALALSKIFENAQEAADLYLHTVKEYTDKADEIVLNAQIEAKRIIKAAKTRAAQIVEENQEEKKIVYKV